MSRRLPCLLALCLLAIIYVRYTSSNLADPDFWGYLAFGRLFWGGEFPYRDIFSYAPTLDRWVYHEWLTGVILYPIWEYLGEAAMQLLLFGCALGAAGLAWATARLRGAPVWAAWIILYMVSFNVGYGYSPFRAQIFTFLFFSLFLWIMESARIRGRYLRLAWLPAIMIPWANIHGGFIAGLLTIGLYAAGELLSRRRFLPYVLAGAASGLVTLINPYGLEYWTYMVDALTMPRPEIEEWWSVFKALHYGVNTLSMRLFLGFAVLGAVLILWNRGRDRTAALVLAATGYMAASHLRHIIFYCLALGALASPFLADIWESLKRWSWFRERAGLIAAGFLAVVIVLPLRSFPEYFDAFYIKGSPLRLRAMTHAEVEGWPIYYPVEALRFMKEQGLTGNILPQFSWGEYCIWELFPESRVSMDGRYETVYPPEVHEAYYEFLNGGPNWRKVLDDLPHDLVLLKPSFRAAALMAGVEEWREAYRDEGSVLFVRKGSGRPARGRLGLEKDPAGGIPISAVN